MADYLAHFVNDAPVLLELIPKIDEDIHAKLQTKGIVTKIDIAVAPKKLSDAEFRAGASLGQAAQLLKGVDADQIEILISTRRRQRGLDISIPGLESWINRLRAADKRTVRAARVTIKENSFSAPEVLDILNQRVTTDEEIKPGTDRRYPQSDRWKALQRAHQGWKSLHK